MAHFKSSNYFYKKYSTMKRRVEKTYILQLLAENVRHYRTKSGMSQEKLAELSDLHPTYISNIEQAKRNLSLENVYKIANALGLTTSELLKEK